MGLLELPAARDGPFISRQTGFTSDESQAQIARGATVGCMISMRISVLDILAATGVKPLHHHVLGSRI
jgi:hypothetical protein